MKKAKEKRSKPRIEAKVQVILQGEDHIHTVTGDLSKTGIFLKTLFPFAKVGEKLSLKIALADDDHFFKLKGSVVRVNPMNQVDKPAGLAVAFNKIDPRYSRNFENMLLQLFKGKGLGCRKYPRAQVDLDIELSSKDHSHQALTHNISMGGLFIKTEHLNDFKLGDKVKINIIHPSTKRKFLVHGEVVHLKQSEHLKGVGIKLVKLSNKRKEDLLIYFKSILSYQKRK
ncbi:PilZ domain-containing protein [bacterium]|nr:PilZ domain-containing protein [bacterium]